MIDLDKLQKKGWLEIDDIESENDLISLASRLGNIIPHPNGETIFCLEPSDGKNSVKGTFSNVFGYSEFPLHTDTAFWEIPARHVILAMIDKSDCETHIINTSDVLSELDQEYLKYAKGSIYMIDTIEGKKYSSLYFRHESQVGFKYDPMCMIPFNSNAKIFHTKFTKILEKIEPESISWTGGKAIIMDNWATLHGRGTISLLEKNRKLLRIYIG